MKKFKYLSLFTVLILFISCEEVIEIDLNSANPVIVVEGTIATTSTAILHLSYTSDYFSNEQSPNISDAVVSISNSKGESEILKSIGEGQYIGKKIRGEENTEYSLSIDLGDKILEGKSKIHSPASLIGLRFEEASFSHPDKESRFGNGTDTTLTYNIHLQISDDPQQENYYLLRIHNGESSDDDKNQLFQDKYIENMGIISISPMMYSFKEGDTVNVKIYTIDLGTYTFYNQLSDVSGGGMEMMMMGTPYNPSSNMGDDVLGYFAAWAVVDTTFIVNL